MNVKVFQFNEKGKIEFTRCELEKLLNEAYNDGHRDGVTQTKNDYWTWTPTITSPTLPITYTTNTTPLHQLKCKSSGENDRKNDITVTTSVNNNTPKTYTFDLSKEVPEFDALAEMIGSMLNPKFAPKTYEAATAIKPKNDVFSNLEKELHGL